MKLSAVLTAAALGVSSVSAEVVFLTSNYLYVNGGTRDTSSGFAYYADNVYPPQFRTDYVDVQHGGFRHWEGSKQSARFASGVTFTSDILASAELAPDNSYAGTATNGFRTFKCYKYRNSNGSKKLIYTDNNWQVYSDYECWSS